MKTKIIKCEGSAHNSYFLSDDLPQKTAELPKDKTIVVTCSVENRSSITQSILERAGLKTAATCLAA
jgi:rhodanese-related sulfurtransferase